MGGSTANVRLEFVAFCGEPCEITSHRPDKLWQEDSTYGVPNTGNARDMGVLCLVGWVFRSPPDCMSAAARTSSIPCPKWRCRCGFHGGRSWEWAPSKMRFGVWERRVQSNRLDDGAGVRGEENAEKSPHLNHLRHRVAWISLRPPVGLGCPSPLFCRRDTRTGLRHGLPRREKTLGTSGSCSDLRRKAEG